MSLREAAEAVIKTLEYAADVADRPGLMGMCENAAELLRTALAEAEEPVAWRVRTAWTNGGHSPWKVYHQSAKPGVSHPECCDFEPLYTRPPRREPLTVEAIDALALQCVRAGKSVEWALREVERAHGIGGDSA